MGSFYREMRKCHRVLLDSEKPAGGDWNYDAENRSGFGAGGPGFVPAILGWRQYAGGNYQLDMPDYADDGLMASKPQVATGKCIERILTRLKGRPSEGVKRPCNAANGMPNAEV
jgi:deoxyribodipyrimidine photolyase-like uncharacterized protein